MKRSRSFDTFRVLKTKKNNDYNLSNEYISQHMSCSICRGELMLPCTLSCGHSFCFPCMKMMHSVQHPDYVNPNEREDDSSGDIEDGSSIPSVLSLPNSEEDSLEADFIENVHTLKTDKLEETNTTEKGIQQISKIFENRENNINELLSDILGGNVQELDWVECDDCQYACPNCRIESWPFPSLNRTLHDLLFRIDTVNYSKRVEKYIDSFYSTRIVYKYEQSFRFKSLRDMIKALIENSNQSGISYKTILLDFADYDRQEVLWAVYSVWKKYKSVIIIVNDVILQTKHIQKHIIEHIDELSHSHILCLLAPIHNPNEMWKILKKKYTSPHGENLSIFMNEEKMLENIKKFIKLF